MTHNAQLFAAFVLGAIFGIVMYVEATKPPDKRLKVIWRKEAA